jgi:hypothetical protein
MPTAAITQPSRQPAHIAAAVTGGIAWIAISLAVGASGVLVGVRPPAPQVIIVALTAATIWITSRGALRSLVDAIPTRALVAVHAVRFVGFVFLAMSAAGALSPLFATRAGWGDIAAAAGAIGLVASGLPTTRLRRGIYQAWNAFAILDLAVAVGTATLVGWRGDVPGITPLLVAPLVLVPTFLVPVLFASHVIIFRRLRLISVES